MNFNQIFIIIILLALFVCIEICYFKIKAITQNSKENSNKILSIYLFFDDLKINTKNNIFESYTIIELYRLYNNWDDFLNPTFKKSEFKDIKEFYINILKYLYDYNSNFEESSVILIKF